MSAVSLGSEYERQDQGESMIFAAAAWICYLSLVTVADQLEPGSVIAALTRFGGVLCVFAALVAFYLAMPKSLSVPKTSVVVLGTLGLAWHLLGVTEIMAVRPEIQAFFGSLLVSQLMYAIALLSFAYCLHRHPHFPSWLAFGMACDGPAWLTFYWFQAHYSEITSTRYAIMLPFLLIEALTGWFFIRNGIRMRRVMVF